MFNFLEEPFVLSQFNIEKVKYVGQMVNKWYMCLQTLQRNAIFLISH